jgi:acyl-CoA dehydrogenase
VFTATADHQSIREAVRAICAVYGDTYWRENDETGTFPEEFVAEMAAGGWLGIAFPESVGGAGLGLTEAAIMMQTVTQSGAGYSGASAIHLNLFGPMPLAKFGSEEQRQRYLPKIISGEDRVCFGVTEPNSGLDTASRVTGSWG